MTDVFQVLKEDHDEVKAMLARLEEGPRARTGATGEQLTHRRQIIDEVIIEEARHEAAEQQYFWPAVRRLGQEGERVADEGLRQEAEAEPVLADLDKLDVADEEFEAQLVLFIAAARAHISYEEAHAWPLLRASITADEAETLGQRIMDAKKVAPTRPHPHVPPQEHAAKTAGPLAGLADRLRDAVTGRGRSES